MFQIRSPMQNAAFLAKCNVNPMHCPTLHCECHPKTIGLQSTSKDENHHLMRVLEINRMCFLACRYSATTHYNKYLQWIKEERGWASSVEPRCLV